MLQVTEELLGDAELSTLPNEIKRAEGPKHIV